MARYRIHLTKEEVSEFQSIIRKLAGLDNPVHQTHYKGNERIETILPKYAVLSTHDARRTFFATHFHSAFRQMW